jgi:hypothetical protein
LEEEMKKEIENRLDEEVVHVWEDYAEWLSERYDELMESKAQNSTIDKSQMN